MAKEQTKTGVRSSTRLQYPSKYNVIFHNDDFTPMEFVVSLLVEVFDRSLDQAKDITVQIHETGQGIAGTYYHEIAEQKQQETIVLSRHNGHPLKVTLQEI
ncbi:MAG: ATP-dependent Clp protease adaptor ClpS [Gammaproteobacteria bacterium]|nr:ATP-dependent Clp protease adaptor ClpS [Gammaproteobacteria bacterium]